MNKQQIFAFLASTYLIGMCSGADPARLDVLNEQRKAAIERSMTQINTKYIRTLEELLKQKIKEGKLEIAVRIRDEISLYQKHPTAVDARRDEEASPN